MLIRRAIGGGYNGFGLVGRRYTCIVFVDMYKCGIEVSRVIGEQATYVWDAFAGRDRM